MGQIRARWIDLRNGLDSGYPLCCVLRFALSRWANQGARRGGNHEWVACGVFHRRTRGPWNWDDYLRPGWKGERYDPSRVERLDGWERRPRHGHG
jgi:hypothetical protein